MMDEKDIDIIKIASEQFPNTIQIDGLDDAIIGLSIRKPNITNYIYSVSKIIRNLMGGGLTYDEATEWYIFNIKPIENVDEKHSPLFFDDRPHFKLN